MRSALSSLALSRPGAARARAIERGWATRQDVEEMAAAVRAWGEAPDALWAALAFAAVGWAA